MNLKINKMKRFKDDPDSPSPTPSLTVDTDDKTESLYKEWKETGKIEGQNTDFPNRNNSLVKIFQDRSKKEKKKKFDMGIFDKAKKAQGSK